MSVNTKVRLRGYITPEEISDFLKEKFGYRIRFGVTTSHYAIPAESKVYDIYKTTGDWEVRSGCIDVIVDDTGEKSRSIFYYKSNLNFRENYESYASSHPELIEMVCSETTCLSLCYDEFAIEVLGAIADEFGGWLCENDGNETYYRVVGKREEKSEFAFSGKQNVENALDNRIDIMTDIETLGRSNGAPVCQIAAVKFDIRTGRILDTFNEVVDITKLNNIEGDTLVWWLNTNKELLTNLLNEGKNGGLTEEDVLKHFVAWVTSGIDGRPAPSQKDIFLWGNGILFDNRLIQNKCFQYGLEYPIHYRNDRDMRTIIELAGFKTGFDSEYAYRKSCPNVGIAHDAFDDVKFQVMVLCKAFSELEKI